MPMGHLWLWIGLFALMGGAIAIDLGVHRHQHEPLGLRAAVGWSLLWIALSIGYGSLVWWHRGSDHAVDFFTAWLVEKSLSFDNLMVFLLLFDRLRVPAGERHRVLTWGIIGAVALRAAMIFGGVALLGWWHPVTYLFGGFLAWTGVRTLLGSGDDDIAPTDKRWGRALFRRLPLVPRFEGGRFFTVDNGRRVGTLLLFALIMVELSDLIFAVDSIPAVIGITSDPQVVFSSNVLALLGLRALFFVVERLIAQLRYLRVGIGLVLLLIGAKMCLSDLVQVPPELSLAVTLAILAATVAASRIRDRWKTATDRTPPPPAPHAKSDARASAPSGAAAAKAQN
jgi:tellurite resistance protein TerC